MSHQEYIAGCDEDQLNRLIELAQERLTAIRATGWVKLWTVSVGWCNAAWFAEEDYAGAVEYAAKAVAKEGERRNVHIEIEINLERYRPEEVAELLGRAK